jgi:hypothetical protein
MFNEIAIGAMAQYFLTPLGEEFGLELSSAIASLGSLCSEVTLIDVAPAGLRFQQPNKISEKTRGIHRPPRYLAGLYHVVMHANTFT